MQALGVFILLTAVTAVKFEIKLYGSTSCTDDRHDTGRGLLGPVDGSQTKFHGILYTWDSYNWTVQLDWVHGGAPDQYSVKFFDNVHELVRYSHGRFGECHFGPNRYVFQDEQTYSLTLLDEPWYSEPSCSTDDDCEDNITCTKTFCDRSIGYCQVIPQHDECGKGPMNVCVPRTCFGGPFHRSDCAIDGDCPAGLCRASECVGGDYDGQPCAASFIRKTCLIGESSTWHCVRGGGGQCRPGGTGGCFTKLT